MIFSQWFEEQCCNAVTLIRFVDNVDGKITLKNTPIGDNLTRMIKLLVLFCVTSLFVKWFEGK